MSNNQHPKDNVYRKQRRQIVDFAFDESVTSVFPDMIRRSVPGYETAIAAAKIVEQQSLDEHIP